MELNKETAAAIVRLAIALIASIFTVLGWSFDQELWSNILMTAVTLYLLVRELWWKNNNVTKAAQEGQIIVDAIKAGEIEGGETAVFVGEIDEDAVFPGGEDA